MGQKNVQKSRQLSFDLILTWLCRHETAGGTGWSSPCSVICPDCHVVFGVGVELRYMGWADKTCCPHSVSSLFVVTVFPVSDLKSAINRDLSFSTIKVFFLSCIRLSPSNCLCWLFHKRTWHIRCLLWKGVMLLNLNWISVPVRPISYLIAQEDSIHVMVLHKIPRNINFCGHNCIDCNVRGSHSWFYYSKITV